MLGQKRSAHQGAGRHWQQQDTVVRVGARLPHGDDCGRATYAQMEDHGRAGDPPCAGNDLSHRAAGC